MTERTFSIYYTQKQKPFYNVPILYNKLYCVIADCVSMDCVTIAFFDHNDQDYSENIPTSLDN